MAQLQHQRHRQQLTLLVPLLIFYSLTGQEVIGIAMHPEEVQLLDTRDGAVDETDLFGIEDGKVVEMFPELDSTHLQPMNNTSRRKLGDFLGCAFCKCCDATATYCEQGIPCCYSINCNVQPFGFCKFVPVSCNCRGCAL